MLQSLDNGALAFIVVDPLVLDTDYHFDLTLEDLKILKTDKVDDLVTYCIVCIGRSIHCTTFNKMGPLVINRSKKLGHQFVLTDSGYSTTEPVITEKPVVNMKKAEDKRKSSHIDRMIVLNQSEDDGIVKYSILKIRGVKKVKESRKDRFVGTPDEVKIIKHSSLKRNK